MCSVTVKIYGIVVLGVAVLTGPHAGAGGDKIITDKIVFIPIAIVVIIIDIIGIHNFEIAIQIFTRIDPDIVNRGEYTTRLYRCQPGLCLSRRR